MKAMTLTHYGEGATFERADVAKPAAGPGEVLVKVAAASVNTVDTMIRAMGKELPLSPELPAILGMDFAGTVEALGDDVNGFAAGDEVYGCAGGLMELKGALVEYMVADARLIARKPKSLSMREAAALPLVAITAFEGLKRAGVGTGQKVLVQGGTGGVGHVAVQLAKHLGADVCATVGGSEQVAIIEAYGATAINYKTEEVAAYVDKHTAGAGFDAIFDSVGGANMIKSFEAAALNASVATTVALLELDLTQAHFKGLSLHVVFMLIPMIHDHGRAEHGAILNEIAEIVEAGRLKPLLDASAYGIDDVGQAFDRLTSGQATGKVVIEH
ncbi:MAG: zinc-dependent alcohol dehydrogenase family protein [Pseudomonadota bacterium]